jgi:methyl-accepting chemotaxis protein
LNTTDGHVRLRDRWRSPDDTRRAGTLMVALGVAGALIAVFGMVVGWVFVGQIATASDDTLDVALQSLDAADSTIDLADGVLAASAEAVDALAATLVALSSSFESGTAAIDDVAALAETIVPSLEDAGSTVRQLEDIGTDIDSVLGALSNLPIGPEYDPTAGLGATFGQLAGTLEALPDQLTSTAGNLNDFTSSAGAVQSEVDRIATSVQSVAVELADTEALIEQYRASVADARALASATNDDLDTGAMLMRILLVAGGVTLLLGQVVPIWLGRSLLDEADRLRVGDDDPAA